MITATNTGAGEARGVTVTDTLPTQDGLVWSRENAGCSISGGALTCDFGTLAPGASKSVHITSPTTAASCALIDNSAEVSTTNDGSAQASDAVIVELRGYRADQGRRMRSRCRRAIRSAS